MLNKTVSGGAAFKNNKGLNYRFLAIIIMFVTTSVLNGLSEHLEEIS
jgi:hypothetical protein